MRYGVPSGNRARHSKRHYRESALDDSRLSAGSDQRNIAALTRQGFITPRASLRGSAQENLSRHQGAETSRGTPGHDPAHPIGARRPAESSTRQTHSRLRLSRRSEPALTEEGTATLPSNKFRLPERAATANRIASGLYS